MSIQPPPSTSSLNRLGKRLEKADPTESDILELEVLRGLFGDAEAHVTGALRELNYEPVLRLSKTTKSIVAKLRRMKTRLSTMQDIAGCRIVVADIAAQNACVAAILIKLPGVYLDDKRLRPSHGYRAVHLIASHNGRPIEIQVRTALQHDWAQLCEKAADVLGIDVKYGGGPEEFRNALEGTSRLVAECERCETEEDETLRRAALAIMAPRARELLTVMRELVSGMPRSRP